LPNDDHKGKSLGGDLQRKLALASDVVVPLDFEHHDTPLRHVFGTSFDIPTSTTPGVVGPGSPGSAEMPARADHSHQLVSGIGVFGITINGTIPTSGNVTLGTLTIPAVAYDRLILAQGMCICSATSASQYQITVTNTDGGVRIARFTGGNIDTGTTVLFPATLLANNVGIITAVASFAAGTSAAATVTADGRFNRLEAFAFPI